MNKTILLLLVFFTHSAFATIWITLADPESKKIAAVGASSGPIGDYRTMIYSDNSGIAVVGSYVLGRRNSYLYQLVGNQALSASELVREFSETINRGPYKRRVSVVNSRFETAAEAGRGCHSDNYYCGAAEEKFFTVMGGGLVSENVVLEARDVLNDPAVKRLPIECQMYKGIEAVFKAGGEKLLFNRLSFVVDDLKLINDIQTDLYFRNGHENSLLEAFAKKIKASGIDCRL